MFSHKLVKVKSDSEGCNLPDSILWHSRKGKLKELAADHGCLELGVGV